MERSFVTRKSGDPLVYKIPEEFRRKKSRSETGRPKVQLSPTRSSPESSFFQDKRQESLEL